VTSASNRRDDPAPDASGRILIVEDDDHLREVLAFNLEDAGFEVTAVEHGREGEETYDADRFDVVITDLRMPEIDGMELLGMLRERDPSAVVVMMTAYGSKDRAVEAMRRGAFHYVEKPVDKQTLRAVVERAVDHRRLQRENRALKRDDADETPNIVAASPEMNEVMRRVDKIADSDATVLIRGESGTGKELVARALHTRSSRAEAPFITVNCAAIPSDLLESELFGHEKGAFTGATEASEGKFAAADGGTLFLDEIAEMSPDLQSKLLRVLQEGEIDVVGANQPRPVDVRVLAATHQPIDDLVEAGQFREDLYFRLNVVPLEIPPLRERREDIPVLFRTFLRETTDASIEVDRSVDEALMAHDWSGNVRELKNVVERMCLLREGDTLTAEDVPDAILADDDPPPSNETELPFELPDDGLDLMGLERQIIEAVLEKTDGNQSAAARYLNLPRHKLIYRMEKFGLKD
jgi:two-component system NtrC family response regulator